MQPWARIYKTALNKPNTLIYSIAKTEQRESLFHWLGLITKVNYFLYKLKTTPIDPSSADFNLNNYSIGTIRESSVHQFLDKLQIKDLHLVKKSRQNIQKLLSGRVNVISGISNIFYENCKAVKLDCSNIEPFYQLNNISTDLYFAINKSTDPIIVNKIKSAYLKVIKNDPLFNTNLTN